jgi:hypothetical protein
MLSSFGGGPLRFLVVLHTVVLAYAGAHDPSFAEGEPATPPDCPALVAVESADRGFIRALTMLARAHRRHFYRKGKAKTFLLELADCLPDEARPIARQSILDADLHDFDLDNASIRATATGRLLAAFRSLVTAWNEVRPAAVIPIEGLDHFDAATAAIAAMGLDEALQRRNGRPELDLFRDAEVGALPALVRFGVRSQFPFTRQPRAFFETLWRHLPPDADPELRERAHVAIEAVNDHDGTNGHRQLPSTKRLLDAWLALVRAFRWEGNPLLGQDVLTMLRAAGAERWVAPPVARFVGAGGSLLYFRRVVAARRGRASIEDVRGFVDEVAATFLEGDALDAFRERLAQLRWSRSRRTTQTNRARERRRSERRNAASGEGSGPTLSGQGEEPLPSLTAPALSLRVPLPGDWESRSIFAALTLLVEAWNEAHPDRRIDAEGLDSPERLFEAFRTMALAVPCPEGSACGESAVEAAAESSSTEESPKDRPAPEVTDAPSSDKESGRSSDEGAPPADSLAPEAPLAAPTPIPPSERNPNATGGLSDGRRARIRDFQAPGGGLAYLRGIMRALRKPFEDRHAVREFILERVRSTLPHSYWQRAAVEVGNLPWRADDGPRGFVDEEVADRILTALETFAAVWNEAHALPRTDFASTDSLLAPRMSLAGLASADGMYRALMWWGIAGPTPAQLEARSGSGFGRQFEAQPAGP